MSSVLYLKKKPTSTVAINSSGLRFRRSKPATLLPDVKLTPDVLLRLQNAWLDYFNSLEQVSNVFRSRLALLTNCELIGSQITVVQSTNPSQVGLSGTIINETQNMFLVQTSKRTVKLIKSTVNLEFVVKSEIIFVRGTALRRESAGRLGAKPVVAWTLRPG